MPDRIKTARLCLIVAGCLKFAVAGLFLFILVIGGMYIGWKGPRADLLGNALVGGLGVALFAAAVAWGVFDVIAASGIGRGRPWGRILGIVLGVVMLPLFPVGTLLALFVLFGLLGREAGDWFAGPGAPGRMEPPPMPPSRLSPY